MAAHTRPTPRPWVVPTVVVGALTLVLLVIVAMQSGVATQEAEPVAATAEPTGPPTRIEGPGEADLSDSERRDSEDPLTAGPVDAPVTLVVFSDYQCPFCATWSHDTLPVMLDRAEAGDLRIEYRDVNVFGEASERASRAAYAAALQDDFWEYHAALYPEGEKLPESELSREALVGLAGELGLDTAQFEADMDAEQTARAIQENEQAGYDAGAFSTPAFVLDGKPLVGAQPTQVFLDAFDEALAANGGG